MAYYRVLEAFDEPGCPVCALRHEAVHRYLDSVLYESVNDVQFRGALIRSRGFCHDHAWELAGLEDSLGTAIIYRDQVAQAIEDLQEAKRRGRWQQARTSAVPCPACRAGDEAAARFLFAIVQHLDQAQFRQAAERSAFLCLPHVTAALEVTETPTQARAIFEIAESKLERLRGELTELIRKRDYRCAGEARGDEQTSWFRAIGQLAGWRPGRRRGR